MKQVLETGWFYFTCFFCLGFILIFPVPFYLLPETGTWIEPWLLPFLKALAGFLFDMNDPFAHHMFSDSPGLYVFVFLLTVVSIFTSLVLLFLKKTLVKSNLIYWFQTIVAYYLSLTLLKYGADKIFKHQFFIPEPNTLFTPLGQLTPDILFWSSMGSSYSYTVFSGIMELIPAVLLLFRKTRLLGALIAAAVLSNVVMINFGFDITVKIYSLFLLFCAIVLIVPHASSLYGFFVKSEQKTIYKTTVEWNTRRKLLIYTIVKTCVIGLMIFESFAIYFQLNNLNDDTFQRPPLHGAYEVISFKENGVEVSPSLENQNRFRRIFFHRRSYFIVQTMDDRFMDYNLKIDTTNHALLLEKYWEYPKSTCELHYQKNASNLLIYGQFFNVTLELMTAKIDLNTLPLLREQWHWTIEDFRVE